MAHAHALDAEISAQHAAIAANVSPAPAFAQPVRADIHETGSPAYAGVAAPPIPCLVTPPL